MLQKLLTYEQGSTLIYSDVKNFFMNFFKKYLKEKEFLEILFQILEDKFENIPKIVQFEDMSVILNIKFNYLFGPFILTLMENNFSQINPVFVDEYLNSFFKFSLNMLSEFPKDYINDVVIACDRGDRFTWCTDKTIDIDYIHINVSGKKIKKYKQFKYSKDLENLQLFFDFLVKCSMYFTLKNEKLKNSNFFKNSNI